MYEFFIFNSLINSEDKTPPTEILLFKYGKNTYHKLGGGKKEINFTPELADKFIQKFSARGLEIPGDYDHQSLVPGAKAVASGWFNSLEKTKDGLVIKVKEWTEAAREHFQKGEYRYFSPVADFVDTWVHSVALTNAPALDNISALVASSFDASSKGNNHFDNSNINDNQGKKMDELLQMLNLQAFSSTSDETAKNKAITEAVKKLVDGKKNVDEFLTLHSIKSLDEMTVRLQSLVPAEDKAKLETELKKRDAEKAVALAMSAGKITEANKDWAVKTATNNLEAFNTLMEGAPVVGPTNQNTDQAETGGGGKVILTSAMREAWAGYSEEEMLEMAKEMKEDR